MANSANAKGLATVDPVQANGDSVRSSVQSVSIWVERDKEFGLENDALSDELASLLRQVVQERRGQSSLAESVDRAQLGIHVGNGVHFVDQKVWIAPVTYTYRPGSERSLLGTHLVAATPGIPSDIVPSRHSQTFEAGLSVARGAISLILVALTDAEQRNSDLSRQFADTSGEDNRGVLNGVEAVWCCARFLRAENHCSSRAVLTQAFSISSEAEVRMIWFQSSRAASISMP